MKHIYNSFVILFLLTAALPTLLYAEAGLEGALSLSDALRTAYLNNPEMADAREEIKAAKGRWLQAEALPDPELEIEVGGLKEAEGSRKGEIGSFAFKQPLDSLGERFLRGRMASDEVKISRSRVDLIWGGVRQRVISLYARILAEEKAVVIAEENLNVTRQFFTRVEVNFQSGKALQSDVIRARIEVSRAENELLIARKNLKVSKSSLNVLLGISAEGPLTLSDSIDYEELRYQYDQITEKAFRDRADIRMETRRLKAAKKGFWRALLKTIFPQMAVGVERTTEEFENDTALILEASYPLWGFNLGEVKEAKAEKQKQAIRLEALKREVGLDVYQAFLEAELADKQVLIQKKALDESNELLRQITVSYGEGEVPFVTYLENIKTIKETRLAYYNALINYKGSVAELERAIQQTPVPEGAK